MLPFKIGATIVCDDVRQEQNNKYILIGVYTGTIVTPGFPVDLPLAWWVQLLPEKTGQFHLDMQLIKDDSAILLRGKVELQINALEWSALNLAKVPLQFQSPGTLKLQLKIPDEEEWQTVNEVVVRKGAVVGTSELLMPVR